MNLLGANDRIAPIAELGRTYGVTVTSGRRPGAITSSGNTSLHASGDAADFSGSPANMARFFAAVRDKYGSKLDELIYTPAGGQQIKNGKPFTYTGPVADDHLDHVHVGYTGRLDGKSGPDIPSAPLFLPGTPQAAFTSAVGALSGAANVVTDPVGSVIGGVFDLLGVNGPRILVHVALILGGAILALAGVYRLTQTTETGRAATGAAVTIATKGRA